MAKKSYKPEEIVSNLRQVDVLHSQGMSMADAIHQIGVSEVTYYRWRKEYGGMKADQLKRLKDLEKENERLRRAVSDLTLDELILAEAARGRHLEPFSQTVLHRLCARPAWRLRTPCLSRARAASFDTASCSQRQRRREASRR